MDYTSLLIHLLEGEWINLLSSLFLFSNGEIVGVYLGRQMDIKHIRKEKLLDLMGKYCLAFFNINFQYGWESDESVSKLKNHV